MTQVLTGPPIPQTIPAAEGSPMPSQSRHALRDSDIVWPEQPIGSFTVSASGTFRRVPVLVPPTTGVLEFGADGVATGLVPDPTVIHPDVAVWAKRELAHIPSYVPLQWDGRSSHCAKDVMLRLAGHPLRMLCLLGDGHEAGCDPDPSPTEALRPSPRKRPGKVA